MQLTANTAAKPSYNLDEAVVKLPNHYMVSARYDQLMFIGSPLLALALALVLEQLPGSLARTGEIGAQEAWIGLFIAVWTFAHLFAVFFRSHGNTGIFARFPYRFTLVPLFVFLGFYVSQWALVTGFVLAAFWDIYHTAMQNFGFCRIYDARRGCHSDRARRLDIGLNQLLYVGPIVGGLSWAPTVAILDSYYHVNWTGGSEIAALLISLQPQLSEIFISCGSIYLIYYLYSYWQLNQEGYVVSRQKIALLTSVGISSVWAWGFLHPFYAFFVANFYHGLQYFAIVWSVEKKSIQRVFHVNGTSHANWKALFLFVLVLTGAGFAYRAYGDFTVHWALALFTTVSLMHFWYDSFVWSAKEVSAG